MNTFPIAHSDMWLRVITAWLSRSLFPFLTYPLAACFEIIIHINYTVLFNLRPVVQDQLLETQTEMRWKTPLYSRPCLNSQTQKCLISTPVYWYRCEFPVQVLLWEHAKDVRHEKVTIYNCKLLPYVFVAVNIHMTMCT